MAETATLIAEVRENTGKGGARATRRAGQVPAVIYGDKQTPIMIAFEDKLIVREINRRGFFTHLFDIDIKGKKHRVLPRDVQFDPVTDRPLHVDFLRVAAHTRIRVAVPLNFINQEKSNGLKRGGMLNVVVHELELLVSPDAMPEHLDIDMTGYEMNASVPLSAVVLPKGAKAVISDADYTVATVVPPAATKSEEAANPAKAAAPAAAGKAPAGKAPAAGKAAAPAAAAKTAPAKKK
jgi:large subunit ribosomal protein L25